MKSHSKGKGFVPSEKNKIQLKCGSYQKVINYTENSVILNTLLGLLK